LAPVIDPSLVASTIATTFGLMESGSQSIQNDLKLFLTGKKMLLVVDLMGSCPGLKMLVTSREAIHYALEIPSGR
jgi:predicted ATPase